MKKVLVLCLVVFVSASYASESNASQVQEGVSKSQTQVSEEIRSGQVLDAKTGKPIEGAAVLFITNDACYEAVTDNQGNYIVRGQFDDEEEQVFIYKYSYLWYRVHDGEMLPFLTYLPNLKQDYRRENNIARLEPFIPEISHREHMGIFEWFPYPERPQFDKALEQELLLAKQEPQINKHAEQSCRSLSQAYKAYAGKEITSQEYAVQLGKVDSPEIRELVQSFRKEYADNAAVPALIAYAKNNVYHNVFDAAICSIDYIFDRGNINYTPHINSVPERMKMVNELEQRWKRTCNKSGVDLLYDDALYASDLTIRLNAIKKIRQLNDPNSVSCLLECLKSQDVSKGIVLEILKSFGDAGNKLAIPEIKKMLLDPDPYIRKEAALTLYVLGDKTGVVAMIASLDASNKNTRSVAVAVLSKIAEANIAEGKNFRQMPPKEQSFVIEKWKTWWNQNKSSFDTSQYSQYAKIAAADKSLRETMSSELTGLEEIGTKDNSPLTVWKELNEAFLAEDVEKAAECFMSFKQDERKQIFQQMKGHMHEMAESISGIRLESKRRGHLSCEFTVEEDECVYSFPVNFSMDDDGQWKIIDF